MIFSIGPPQKINLKVILCKDKMCDLDPSLPPLMGRRGEINFKKFFKNILDNFKKGAIILVV